MIQRILGAYIVELQKYSRLAFPYFGPVFVLLAVLGSLLVHPVRADGDGDLAFIGLAVPAALNIVGFLLLLVYGSGLVAGEIESGTIRAILVRPLFRSELLAAKLLNAMTYAVLLTFTATAGAWAVVVVLGETSGVGFGGELIYTGQELFLAMGIAVYLNLVSHLTGAAFAIMISTLARRSATAISASIGLWLLVEYTKHAFRLERFIFSTYLDVGWTVYADRCSGLATPFLPEALYAIAVNAAWFAFFVGIAAAAIRRRDFGP